MMDFVERVGLRAYSSSGQDAAPGVGFWSGLHSIPWSEGKQDGPKEEARLPRAHFKLGHFKLPGVCSFQIARSAQNETRILEKMGAHNSAHNVAHNCRA